MEELRHRSLLVSHFITHHKRFRKENTKTETVEVEAFNRFIDSYNKDFFELDRIDFDKVDFVKFLEIIELEKFKSIVESLHRIYQNEYPYSEKKDFIEFTFHSTIGELDYFFGQKRLIESMPRTNDEKNYDFYKCKDGSGLAVFAIDQRLDIEHYRQYYKVVINYLNSFAEDALPPQQIEKLISEQNEAELSEKVGLIYRNSITEYDLPPKAINTETEAKKYTAKHYVLAYIFEGKAKGESFPRGNKKELERIGNERIGAGKGNRFYKVFNKFINRDLNTEIVLTEIVDENWRDAVIDLSKSPELVEDFLIRKDL